MRSVSILCPFIIRSVTAQLLFCTRFVSVQSPLCVRSVSARNSLCFRRATRPRRAGGSIRPTAVVSGISGRRAACRRRARPVSAGRPIWAAIGAEVSSITGGAPSGQQSVTGISAVRRRQRSGAQPAATAPGGGAAALTDHSGSRHRHSEMGRQGEGRQ